MTGTALVLIGNYASAPAAVKAASRQQEYAQLHGMGFARGAARPTPWVSEYTGETDVNPATGHLAYFDCVQAAYVACASLMTHGRVAATPANREALQAREVEMGFQKSKLVGSGLEAAAAAGKAMWGIPAIVSQAAATIKAALDDGSGLCWCHDSMNKDGEWVQVPVSAAVAFAATYAAKPNQYLKITEEPALPDTGTGAGMDYVVRSFDPPVTLHFAQGTYTGYRLDGTRKTGTLAAPSTAKTDGVIDVPSGKAAITGHFYHVVDGIWAGYNIPFQSGVHADEPVAPPPPSPAPDCTKAVADAVAPLNTQIASLTAQLASAQAKIAAAKKELG
jgi:hypothetical protein